MPLAAAVKVTFCPAATVRLLGEVVITGGWSMFRTKVWLALPKSLVATNVKT